MQNPSLRFRRCFAAALCGSFALAGSAFGQLPAPAASTDAAASEGEPQPGAAARAADAPQIEPIDTNAPLRSGRRGTHTLERCIALTLKNYPKIHEARARLDHRRAQQQQAHTQPYSEFNMTGGLALVPEVRGTPVYSPDSDVAISSDMGLAWNIGIEGAIPLWTFGKISNLWDAAGAQVTLAEHEVEKEKNLIKIDVRRAYYGLQLARDALALISEAEKRIDKYLVGLEKKIRAGDGDEIEFYKLKIHRAELTARGSEARQKHAVALAGLRFLTGVSQLDLPDEPLAKTGPPLAPLASYLSAARLYRPEVNMLRAGLQARQAQLQIERARYFPDLALGLSARWAKAPGITDQTNPFVRDTINAVSYGAALILRYKLDFLPQSARVAQARAQLEELRATERYALGGIAVEVEQAYREAQDAAIRLEAYSEAASLARKWLLLVQQGIDVGASEEEELVDPAKEWALKRFAVMSATFDYNVALGKLAQATGWEAVARSP
jgi:outer membrane protein TolC